MMTSSGEYIMTEMSELFNPDWSQHDFSKTHRLIITLFKLGIL